MISTSLGAAVAVMDAMMLRTTLPASVEMTTTVFGLPRSGNQQWADFVDSTVSLVSTLLETMILISFWGYTDRTELHACHK